MASKSLVLTLLGHDKSASKALESVGRSSESLVGRLKTLTGVLAGAFAAKQIIDFGAQVIQQASDLEQNIGGVEAIFKESADQIKKWSKTAAQDVGLTENEFDQLATLIGAQLKNGGTAMEDLAPKVNDLIGLGADLSAMYGGTAADAIKAISATLRGERDPIERYGVSIRQSTVDAKAAELGFKKVSGALSVEATQAATLAIIMDQTTDAHGRFASEADTFAGKQQRLQAGWEDMTTEIGEALLPAAAQFMDELNKHLPEIESFIKEDIVPALTSLGDWFTSTGLDSIGGFFDFLQKWKEPIGWLIENVPELTGAVWLLNIAMDANPVGAVAAAFGLLVLSIFQFVNNIDKITSANAQIGKNIMNVWFNVAQTVGGVLQTIANGFIDAYNTVASIFGWGQLNRLNITGMISVAQGKLNREFDLISKFGTDTTAASNAYGSIYLTPGGLSRGQRIALGLPMLANGGDITAPGSFIVGERGMEVLTTGVPAQVRPLKNAGMGDTYNIVVNGFVGDRNRLVSDLAREVENAKRRGAVSRTAFA